MPGLFLGQNGGRWNFHRRVRTDTGPSPMPIKVLTCNWKIMLRRASLARSIAATASHNVTASRNELTKSQRHGWLLWDGPPGPMSFDMMRQTHGDRRTARKLAWKQIQCNCPPQRGLIPPLRRPNGIARQHPARRSCCQYVLTGRYWPRT